jgi:hypothetical protein
LIEFQFASLSPIVKSCQNMANSEVDPAGKNVCKKGDLTTARKKSFLEKKKRAPASRKLPGDVEGKNFQSADSKQELTLQQAMKKGFSTAAQYLQEQADKRSDAKTTPKKSSQGTSHHSPPKHTPQGRKRQHRPDEVPNRHISQPQLLHHQCQYEPHTQLLQQQHNLLQKGWHPLPQQQTLLQQQPNLLQKGWHLLPQQKQTRSTHQLIHMPLLFENIMCDSVIPLQPMQPFNSVKETDSRSSQCLLPLAQGLSRFATATFQSEVAPLQSETAQACPVQQPADPASFMTSVQQLPSQSGARQFVGSLGPFCSHANRCDYL